MTKLSHVPILQLFNDSYTVFVFSTIGEGHYFPSVGPDLGTMSSNLATTPSAAVDCNELQRDDLTS